MEDRSQHDLE
jgi:hypothetical protein